MDSVQRTGPEGDEMTTNHKPALESRQGRDVQTSILHSRDQPSHKQLKYRAGRRHLEELKEELGVKRRRVEEREEREGRGDGDGDGDADGDADGGADADADGDGASASEASDGEASDAHDSDTDSEDEAELMRELQKIKQEREEQRKLEQMEAKMQQEKAKPRKSWRQDTMFKETSKKKDGEYVNDLLRSDEHQKFMDKFIR